MFFRDYDDEVGCEGTLQHVDTTSSGEKNKGMSSTCWIKQDIGDSIA